MSSHSLDEKVAQSPSPQEQTITTTVAKNAAFEATRQTAKLNVWTRDSMILLAGGFISYMCAIANGYDGSLMGAITAMPYYKDYFKGAADFTAGTGLIFSIYTVGQIVGGLVSGPISDRLGRRGGMFVGCMILVVGTIIISSAHHKEQFIAGRFILGWGIAIAVTCAPTYCVEIAPPQWRGRMTGFYNTGWFGGSIPAAAITLGTQYMKSDWSWRLPLIFQAVPAGIVCIVVFFLPESPRWLYAQGREEEARAFLVRFHGAGDPNSPYITLQVQEFIDSIKLDGSDKRWWDFRELVSTKNARWRFLMVAFMAVFGQFSGNGLGYFNPQIFKLLGYGTIMQFVLNLATTIVSATGAYTGVYFTDRMPRRPVLIYGTLACSAMLAINGGLSAAFAPTCQANADGNCTGNPKLPLAQGALAAYFLFNAVISFTYTPLQALYPVECLTTETRAKGMGAYQALVNVISFINLFAGPIALRNIKHNYIFVFVGWDIVEALLWYLFAVETSGRTLEELDELFSAPNPVKTSKQKHIVAIKEGGHAVILDKA
ncbi:putative MFS lactose permease [Auricularia subglabra TFB-10046 SS5]|nr:putative MFS lactose permease [Auricularia subglabra TFB-10046 SS5]